MEMSTWTVNGRRYSGLPCNSWMLRGIGEPQSPINPRRWKCHRKTFNMLDHLLHRRQSYFTCSFQVWKAIFISNASTNSNTEPTATTPQSSSVQWPDHISDKTLEKMASTILSDNDHEHGQLFYQYCICVYVKAIFLLYQKPRAYKDPRIHAQFLKSKKLYETYAFRALKSLNFLNPPTLPFIQALISAVSYHSFFDKQVFH